MEAKPRQLVEARRPPVARPLGLEWNRVGVLRSLSSSSSSVPPLISISVSVSHLLCLTVVCILPFLLQHCTALHSNPSLLPASSQSNAFSTCTPLLCLSSFSCSHLTRQARPRHACCCNTIYLLVLVSARTRQRIGASQPASL